MYYSAEGFVRRTPQRTGMHKTGHAVDDGKPETVVAVGKQLRPEYGEYDHVATPLQYPNGVVGMLSHSECLSAAQNHFHVHGTAGNVMVEPNRIVVQASTQPEQIVDLPVENAYITM
jgi:predicted dehydrogenase